MHTNSILAPLLLGATALPAALAVAEMPRGTRLPSLRTNGRVGHYHDQHYQHDERDPSHPDYPQTPASSPMSEDNESTNHQSHAGSNASTPTSPHTASPSWNDGSRSTAAQQASEIAGGANIAPDNHAASGGRERPTGRRQHPRAFLTADSRVISLDRRGSDAENQQILAVAKALFSNILPPAPTPPRRSLEARSPNPEPEPFLGALLGMAPKVMKAVPKIAKTAEHVAKGTGEVAKTASNVKTAAPAPQQQQEPPKKQDKVAEVMDKVKTVTGGILGMLGF